MPNLRLQGTHETFFSIQPLVRCSSENGLYRPWYDPQRPDAENQRAKKAYEAVLTVTASSSSESAEYEAFAQAVKQLSKEKFNYTYEGPVNNFVANFHDAVSPIGVISGQVDPT
jgi:hypothetical protein